MHKRAVGLGLVMLACIALVACGGDTKRLTATELTAKGNTVCAKLDADVKALAETIPVSISFTPEQMQDFYAKIVPLVDKAVTAFKALEPPKDLEATYDSALVQVQIDRKTLAGATASPAAAKNLFDTQVDPFTATNQKLAAAGITGCGGTPGTGGSGAPTTGATGGSGVPTTGGAGAGTTTTT